MTQSLEQVRLQSVDQQVYTDHGVELVDFSRAGVVRAVLLAPSDGKSAVGGSGLI
jgi:hypothetical protein